MLKSRFLFSALLLAAVCMLSGCVSFNEDKFAEQVKKWAPLGTPRKDVERAMAHHGFDCNFISKDSQFNFKGADYLACDKEEAFFHTWNAIIFFKDDKVSGYGPATVEE
jgi:hypothetical protein